LDLFEGASDIQAVGWGRLHQGSGTKGAGPPPTMEYAEGVASFCAAPPPPGDAAAAAHYGRFPSAAADAMWRFVAAAFYRHAAPLPVLWAAAGRPGLHGA